MKLRDSTRNDDGVELQMTPMIDIVFQLLIFFIMTFKITAMEGDFTIKMPKAGSSSSSEDFIPPLYVQLKAAENGSIAEIVMGDDSLGTDFGALSRKIIERVGSGPETEKIRAETEVELDCDQTLRYEETVKAITAITGYKNEQGDLVKLLEKIKFRDNTGQ